MILECVVTRGGVTCSHKLLTLFCMESMPFPFSVWSQCKKGTLSQQFVTHVVPPPVTHYLQAKKLASVGAATAKRKKEDKWARSEGDGERGRGEWCNGSKMGRGEGGGREGRKAGVCGEGIRRGYEEG